jgi:hypothetical protein
MFSCSASLGNKHHERQCALPDIGFGSQFTQHITPYAKRIEERLQDRVQADSISKRLRQQALKLDAEAARLPRAYRSAKKA